MRKPKYPNSQEVIDSFYKAVSDSYNSPAAGEVGDIPGKKKQELLAEEFDISRLKVRKILITTGDYISDVTAEIQAVKAQGGSPEEMLGMAESTVNSYLPYQKCVYKLKAMTEQNTRSARPSPISMHFRAEKNRSGLITLGGREGLQCGS